MNRSEMTSTLVTRGFFGVAAYRPKTESNVGTLWRSASTYGASFVATLGARYRHQASDTCKTPLSTPLWHFDDIGDLHEHLPHGCQLIGVELTDDAVSLTKFAHPRAALYLMGAEDHGLPASVLEVCHQKIQIPTPADWSLNVSVAGSIVMHDRFVKAVAE